MSWSDVDREVSKIEAHLKPTARSFQLRALRFLSIFFPAFMTAIIGASPQHWTLSVFLSVTLSVGVTALGELDPSIPWSTLVGIFDRSRTGTLPDVPPAKGSGS